MRSIGICVAVACALIPQAAWACDAIAGRGGESPLHTRKPVVGDDVRLTSGFGMRRDPILNTRKLHAGIDWAAPIGTPSRASDAHGGERLTNAGLGLRCGHHHRRRHGKDRRD